MTSSNPNRTKETCWKFQNSIKTLSRDNIPLKLNRGQFNFPKSMENELKLNGDGVTNYSSQAEINSGTIKKKGILKNSISSAKAPSMEKCFRDMMSIRNQEGISKSSMKNAKLLNPCLKSPSLREVDLTKRDTRINYLLNSNFLSNFEILSVGRVVIDFLKGHPERNNSLFVERLANLIKICCLVISRKTIVAPLLQHLPGS